MVSMDGYHLLNSSMVFITSNSSIRNNGMCLDHLIYNLVHQVRYILGCTKCLTLWLKWTARLDLVENILLLLSFILKLYIRLNLMPLLLTSSGLKLLKP